MFFDDNEELRLLADELDIYLQESCMKYKTVPLALSAVLLARLIHLNGVFESKEDFGKLLVSVGNSLLNKELDKPRNVH
jgi:hypothetical protein